MNSPKAIRLRLRTRSAIVVATLAWALTQSNGVRAADGTLYKATKGPHAIVSEPLLTLRDAVRDKDLQLRVTWPTDAIHPAPVIVWSHGATGTKDDYQPLVRHWASHGYVCIQANHSDSRVFGKTSGPARFTDWANRPKDVAFILDSLAEIERRVEGLAGTMDKEVIAVGGHSFGAHTSQLVGGVTTVAFFGQRQRHADPRPRAFLLISPQGKGVMLDEQSWDGLTRPAMTVTGSNDRGRTGQDWTWRLDPFTYAPPEDKFLVTIDGAYHGFGGIAGATRYANAGPGNPRQLAWVRSVSTAFWDAFLRESAEAQAFLRSDDLRRLSGGAARITVKAEAPEAKGKGRPAEPWVTPAIQAPGLKRHVFHSTAVQADVSCHVYTPEAYAVEPNRRFPVVYWLHGRGGGKAGMVSRLVTHFDRAVRTGAIAPVLVVVPNGMAESMWCDSKDGRVPMETIVAKELVPYIDRTFRTIASREGRMIEGFSMGGYGAARLGLKYHDLFGAVSVLGAGPMQREFSAAVGPSSMARTRLRVLHSVYGDDQAYFQALSPWTLAEEHVDALRGKLNLRLAVGSRDGMLEANRDFSEHLARLQIPHALHVLPDVGHHPIALFNALGDANWAIYRQAFGDTRARQSTAEPRMQVLVLGKSRLIDPPRQQKRAADAVHKIADAAGRLGTGVVVDTLVEEVMTREEVRDGESTERVTGSVFLGHLARLAETVGPEDTVIVYTHTHGVKKGVPTAESPGGLVLNSPFRRSGHRALLAWDEYADQLLRIPAKHVVVLTMACFSGGLVDTLESPPVKARWEHRREKGRSLLVLTSQDSDTMSPPIVVDRELINPFTYAVARAFAGAADGFVPAADEPDTVRSGDGKLTLGELIDCILHTTQHTPSEWAQRPNIARPRVTGSFNRDSVLCRFDEDSADSEGLTPVSASRLSAGRHTVSITVDGWRRSYLVHVPAHIDAGAPLPVVIMFHGGGGRAEAARWETGWDRKADREGFLAVFPEGTPPDSSRPGHFVGNPQTWNDGSGRDFAAVRRNAPDIAFVDALINDLKTRCAVNDRRIYVTGFSNGASMAFRVARERPDLVAAAAPVAGGDWLTGTHPSRPVPLLYITGSADSLNPLEGGDVSIGPKRYGRKPAVEAMIDRWVELHGCPSTPSIVLDRDGAKGVAYGRPNAADVVVWYTLDGQGHHWPGGKSLLPRWIAGPNNARLRATDLIWAFFEQHAKPTQQDGE